MRIKIPELTFSVAFESHQDSPMASNPQHYSENQWFLSCVVFEIVYFFIELIPRLFWKDQILVLKLPSEVNIGKVLMIFLENIKVIKHFSTNLIVRSLKISKQNIILSPGPFIFKLIGMFDLKQKLFDFLFKFPKRCPTVNNILTF